MIPTLSCFIGNFAIMKNLLCLEKDLILYFHKNY